MIFRLNLAVKSVSKKKNGAPRRIHAPGPAIRARSWAEHGWQSRGTDEEILAGGRGITEENWLRPISDYLSASIRLPNIPLP
jgi:hypothetical protein